MCNSKQTAAAYPLRAPTVADGVDFPIVVLGHQRSGTSAVAWLLSRATGRRIADDPPWTFTRHVRKIFSSESLTAEYLSRHKDDLNAGILKAPSLTPIACGVQRALPNGKFVVVVRDPRDNICSVLEWRRHRDPQAADNFWDQDWMGLEAENRVALLAKRWNRYLDFASRLHQPHWVKYETFCSDKPSAIATLCSRLGVLALNPVEKEQDQQFKKDFGNRRIVGAERWQRELRQEDVATIEAICADQMQAFDFPLACSPGGGATAQGVSQASPS